MSDHINTRDLDATAGAVYFAVGRGTEGGVASYHLAIAGITVGLSEPHWGVVERVALNSGYSLGAIQVDFGQRGSWPLGAITGRALQPGESTYVDAVIAQASAYARAHDLPFAQDHERLRTQLLSHGNGQGRRSSIQFIDTDTRDSINAWAGSDTGKQWIHTHIDYPQVRNATTIAMTMLDTHGSGIAEADRFEAISIIAKTANQIPSQLPRLEKVLRDGGSYSDLRALAGRIGESQPYYDGPKAGDIAQRYEAAYALQHDAMDRAHAKVAAADYAPGSEAADSDIRIALSALEPVRELRLGAAGADVLKLENNLAVLGFAGQPGWAPDRRFDTQTQAAVSQFQQANGISPADGQARADTLAAIQHQASDLQQRLHQAGMTDRQGRTLTVDGYLGADTRHALSQYQQQQGLDITGIADARTRQALPGGQPATPTQEPVDGAARFAPASVSGQTALSSPLAPSALLTDTGHRHHALYQQALAQVHQAEVVHGIAAGQHSIQLAAALTTAAVEQGLSRIDRVELNGDGTMVRATQVSEWHDESALNLSTAPVSTHEAVRHSLHEHSVRSMAATAAPPQPPHANVHEQEMSAAPARIAGP